MDIYHHWHAAAVNVNAQRACNRGALPCRYAFAAIAGGDRVGWATDSMGKSLLIPYLGIFGHLIALAAGMVLLVRCLIGFVKKTTKYSPII